MASSREHSPSDHPGRRAERRYPANADVEIGEPFNAHGLVINASDGGLRVAVDKALPVGAVCVVDITTDAGVSVEIVKVAWIEEHTDGYLVGLSYTHKE